MQTLTCLLLLLSSGAVYATKGWIGSLNGLDYNEEVAVLTLQGLVNRHEANLLINSSSLFWQYPQAVGYWSTYFAKHKGYTFTEVSDDLRGLLKAFKGYIGGVAIYDPVADADATRYLAVMACAQNPKGGLPVTPTMLHKYSAELGHLPVIVDFRGKWPGHSDTSEHGAWNYALGYYMANVTDRTMVYSVGRSHGKWNLGSDHGVQIGLDYGVAQNSFIMNLSPNGTGYPGDADLFNAVVSRLDPLPAVFGWSEPESDYTTRVTQDGGYVMCDCAPDMSFWAHVPTENPGGKFKKLPRHKSAKPPAKDKYSIVFQTNEGDTPKIVTGLMSGQWVSPNRGSVPISWGINPGIAIRFPSLIEFYATTAMQNDTFFSGCSGAGYAYPRLFPDWPNGFNLYAKHVRDAITKYTETPWVVDIWDESGVNFTLLAHYKEQVPEIGCFTFQGTDQWAHNWCNYDGTPILQAAHSLWYPNLGQGPGALMELVKRIKKIADENEPPFTIIVYGLLTKGDLPEQVLDLAPKVLEHLGDEFQIIGIPDMCDMAQERCKLEAGRN